jgi:hypothetical protein
MNSLKDFYVNETEKENSELNKIKRRLNLISIFRLLSFVLFIVLPFKLYKSDELLAFITAILFLIVFLYLSGCMAELRQQAFYSKPLEIYKNELCIGSYLFSIDGGEEFIDPSHINSYDLDLFGKGSLFSF